MSNLYHKDIYDFDNPVKSYWEANTNTDLNLEKLIQQIELKIMDGVLVKTDNKLHPSRDYKFLTDGIASDLFIT